MKILPQEEEKTPKADFFSVQNRGRSPVQGWGLGPNVTEVCALRQTLDAQAHRVRAERVLLGCSTVTVYGATLMFYNQRSHVCCLGENLLLQSHWFCETAQELSHSLMFGGILSFNWLKIFTSNITLKLVFLGCPVAHYGIEKKIMRIAVVCV